MKRNKQPTPASTSQSEEVRRWSVAKLKEFLTSRGIDFSGVIEKSALVELVVDALDDDILAQASSDSSCPDGAEREEKLRELPSAVSELSRLSASDLIRCVPTEAQAVYFRQNPSKFAEVLHELLRTERLNFASRPKVARWLTAVANGPDKGQLMLRALSTQQEAVCGKQLVKSDVAFKCLTCAADPTCIMCVDCFKQSPCQQHDYRMIRSGGGMCDCGDATAWKKESFCTKHRGISSEDDPTKSIPQADRPWTFAVLRGSLQLVARICEFIVDASQLPADSELEALLAETATMLQAIIEHGDCAKRVVCLLLCEDSRALHGTGGYANSACFSDITPTTTTVLETIFMFDYHKASNRLRRWSTVTRLIFTLVSDPFIKEDVCRLLLKYAERSVVSELAMKHEEQKVEKKLMSIAVQVYTVPPVVEAMLQPAKLRLTAAAAAAVDLGDASQEERSSTTIVHRLVSSIIFALTQVASKESKQHVQKELNKPDEPALSASTDLDTVVTRFTLQLDTAAQDNDVTWFVLLQKCYELKYVLKASARARNFFLTTRNVQISLIKTLLLALESSHGICRDPDSRAETNIAWEVENCFSKIVLTTLEDVRRLIRWVRGGGKQKAAAAESSAQPAASIAGDGKADGGSTVDFPKGLELMSRRKCLRFPLPPDSTVATPLFSKLLAMCSADDGAQQDGSFLQDLATISAGDDASIDFITNFLAPFWLMVAAVGRHRAATAASRNVPVLSSVNKQRKADLLQYDILSDTDRPKVYFASPITRIISLVCKTFLSETPPGAQEDGSGGKSLFRKIAAKLCTVPGVVENMFDGVLMRSVLESQVQEDLWKRNFMNVMRTVQIHQRINNFYFRETDVFTLQLLTAICAHGRSGDATIIPTVQDLSHQWLARFSYQPAANRLEKENAPVGYAHYLRHVLTVVSDASKSMHNHCSAYETLKYSVIHILAAGMRTRSQIVEKLKSHVDDADDDEGSFDEQLTRCLGEVAVVSTRKDGNVYALNDDCESVWKAVTPYHGNFTLDELASATSRWVLTMTRQKKQNPSMKILPCAHLTTSHHSDLAPALYALLHTDAVLSTVIWILQCKAIKLKASASRDADDNSATLKEGERKKTRVEGENDSSSAGAALPEVSDQLFNHAISVLYQLAQHAALITSESASALVRETGTASPIAISKFQAQYISTTSFAAESVQRLLPCPEISSASNISTVSGQPGMSQLHIPIKVFNLAILSRKPIVVENPMTTIEAIRVLRNAARDDRDRKLKKWASQKQPSDVEPPLIEETALVNGFSYILQVLGGDEADSFEGSAKPSAEESLLATNQADREKRIKEKQRLLMEKMKKKQERAAAAFSTAGPDAQQQPQSARVTTDDDGMTSTSDTASAAPHPTNLHAALMMRCAELECCFCQLGDDDPAEPLLWLCHATTSNSIALLKPHVMPSSYLHGHVHMCGHAAHEKCIHRHHQQLGTMRSGDVRQLLMHGRGFRGIMYLGAAEFLCPMCSRVVSSVSLVPKLWTTVHQPSSLVKSIGGFLARWIAGSGEKAAATSQTPSLVSTPQASTSDFAVDSGYLRDWAACMAQSVKVTNASTEFRTSAFHAAIGLSTSSDQKALVDIGNLAPQELAVETFLRSCDTVAATITCLVENSLCGLAPTWRDFANVVSSILAISLLESKSRDGLTAAIAAKLCSTSEASPEESFNSVKSLGETIGRCVLALSDTISLSNVLAEAASRHLLSFSKACSSSPAMLWRELAPLALLKLALLGEPGNEIATVSGGESGSSMEMQLTFLNLNGVGESAWDFAAMCTPLRAYIFQDQCTTYVDSTLALPDREDSKDSRRAPTLIPVSMPQWKTLLLNEVLHLPTRYDQLVVRYSDVGSKCSICGKPPMKPVFCLTCGMAMCVQNRTSAELFDHSRTCAKGVGLFILIKATTFLVLDAVGMRAMQPSSVYVDRYGERDESIQRGVALSLSPRFSEDLLRQFICCGWDTDPAVLRTAWKHAIEEL